MIYEMEHLNDYQRMAVQTLRKTEVKLSVNESVAIRNCLAIADNISTIIQDQKLRIYGPMERQSVFTIIGLIGESGEFIDLVKKYVFHKQDMVLKTLADEAGDVMWYVATTAHVLGYSMKQIDTPINDTMLALKLIIVSVKVICDMFTVPFSEVLEGNITKLHDKRYPNGFRFGGGDDRGK